MPLWYQVQASVRACAPIPLTSAASSLFSSDPPLLTSSPIPETADGEATPVVKQEKPTLVSYSCQWELSSFAAQFKWCGCLSSGQSDADQAVQLALEKLDVVLSGEHTIKLHLQFLIKNNKTDMLILRNTKVSVSVHLLTLPYTADYQWRTCTYSRTYSRRTRSGTRYVTQLPSSLTVTCTVARPAISSSGTYYSLLYYCISYLPQQQLV